MSALATLVLMSLAALGYGAALLRLLGCLGELPSRERLAQSFVLGFGIIGWLMFWLGIGQGLTPVWLVAALLPGLAGLAFLKVRPSWPVWPGRLELLLLSIIALVAVADILQALLPPGDADSLAYHFALPKQFLDWGRIVFQPRAVEGAIPLLVQMTSMTALGLGGEQAMTGWMMLSGWASAFLVWALARRWMDQAWALAAALAWKTAPVVIYAAGTGQVEVRTAMFATIAAFAVAEVVRGGHWRWAALAGMASGLFMASKYPGLFFMAGAGLIVLALAPRRISAALAYGVGALVAGGQWYGWNWWHTGDPVFPMLWAILPHPPNVLWSDHAAWVLSTVFGQVELVLPRNPWGALIYPFQATLAPDPVFEAGRTGFGPLIWLLLPFSALSLWQARFRAGRMGTACLVVGVVYLAWFLFGPSQRLRHLMPLLPVAILATMVGIARLRSGPMVRVAAVSAVVVAVMLQLGGQVIFSIKFIRGLQGDRENYMESQVPGYSSIKWINSNLPAGSKVFNQVRWLNYGFERDYFYGHFLYQSQVNLSDGTLDAPRFWRELNSLGITHILYIDSNHMPDIPGSDGLLSLTSKLLTFDCARELYRQKVVRPGSRTLSSVKSSIIELSLVELTPATCSLSKG